MSIYLDLSICTLLPLALATCKQLVAVSTPVQKLVTILEQYLQFLHIQLALEFVLLILEALQSFNADLGRQSLDQGTIHTVHVDWQVDDLLEVVRHETETLLDQWCHLQEVRRYQDGDRVLDLQLWLQRVHILHQPVKDGDVTVNRDIDVFQGL